MKNLSLSVLLSLLLLLAACGGPAAVSPGPDSGETPAPSESLTPAPTGTLTPEPTQSERPDLPWTVSAGEALPYDEYFAQRVEYLPEQARSGWMSNGLMPAGDGYSCGVARSGSKLELWSTGREDALLWTIADLPGAQPATSTTRWLYVVVDGRELIRMDYYGEDRTTVFTDDTGLLGELMFDPETGRSGFFLLGEELTYFLAGTEDGGVGVYRLYLPEDRTELLYRYTAEQVEELTFSKYIGAEPLAARIQIEAPAPLFRKGLSTNQWVYWETGNREFYTFYAELAADPEKREMYLSGYAGEIEQGLEEFFDVDHAILYYADLEEDLLYTVPVDWLDTTVEGEPSPFSGGWIERCLDQEKVQRQNLGLRNMV